MDELIIVGLLVAVALGFFVALPIVAFVSSRRTRARLEDLQREFAEQESKLRYLYDQNTKLQKRLQAGPVGVDESAATAPSAPANSGVDSETLSTAAKSGVDSETLSSAANSDADSEALSSAANSGVDSETLSTAAKSGVDSEALSSAANSDADSETLSSAANSGADSAREPPPPAKPPQPSIPLEQRLAGWFTKAGAGALLLGVLYFFKYAVDNDWIGPAGRVLIGLVAGVVLVVLSEVLRSRVERTYQHILVGVGLSLLIISGWAAGVLYHLVEMQIAFAGNALVLFAGTALAFRHRAEAVLGVVLIAGFANPVVLSTGQDRPFALFAYLALLTAGALWVSAERKFRFTTALAILGVIALGGGWYEKFFKVHDLRTVTADIPVDEAVGAYLSLGARIVPIAFTALFTFLWLATAELSRRREEVRGIVTTIVLVALTFAHGSVTALLHDQPLALGAALCIIAGISVATALWFRVTHLLIFPLLIAFGILLGLGAGADPGEQNILLIFLGAWTAIYGGAFVHYARTQAEFRTVDVARIGVVLACLMITAGVWLLPDRSGLAAAIGAITTCVFVWVAQRGRSPQWLLGSAVAAFMFLAICAAAAISNPEISWSPALVGLAFATAAIHMWGADRASGYGPAAVGLISTAFTVLGFAAVSLIATHESAETLRAIWLAVAAGLSLAGAEINRLRQRHDQWSSVLAALALGLAAAAVGFAMSGAPLTVLWAILAAVTASIHARRPAPVWAVSLGLFIFVVLVRLATYDLQIPRNAAREFWQSGGLAGSLAVDVFFNPRAYALLGSGMAALVGGALLGKNNKTRVEAALVLILGYACLLILTIVEVRNGLTDLPALPASFIPSDEIYAFKDLVRSVSDQTQSIREVATTLVLGVFAGVLLVIGFALKDPFHRWLGLTLFFVTLGKLVGYDVWQLPRIFQVVVLTGVGAMLLAAGFLYARLKALFIKGTAATIVLVGLSSVADAQPSNEAPKVQVWEFDHRFGVAPPNRPGDYLLELPIEVVAGSKASNKLSDLRFADKSGFEIPYVVRTAPAQKSSRWHDTEMFDSGEVDSEDRDNNASRAMFEIPQGIEHCEVRLQVKGGYPYVRRAKIEVGPAQDELTTVASGGLVFQIRHDNWARRLRYPISKARWMRVTLGSDSDARAATKIKGAQVACTDPASVPPTQDVELKIIEQGPGEREKTSQVIIDVGRDGIPIDRLELDIEDREFVRRLEIQASTHRQVWPQLKDTIVWRAESSTTTIDSMLHIRFNRSKKRYYRLVFKNGDNAPLNVLGVKGSTKIWQAILRAKAPGEITGYVGAEIYRPNYDLADILKRKGRFEGPQLKVLALEANPEKGNKPPDRPPPWTEQHRGLIGWVVAALALLIGAWAFMVVRRQEPDAE